MNLRCGDAFKTHEVVMNASGSVEDLVAAFVKCKNEKNEEMLAAYAGGLTCDLGCCQP